MQHIQLISFTPDELSSLIQNAVQHGVAEGISKAKDLMIVEEPVNTAAAMVIARYKDKAAFRQFCIDNEIQPVGKSNKENMYLPSQIRAAQRFKGMHK